jgi:uncharacterized protein YndB with AHSA1/START domain
VGVDIDATPDQVWAVVAPIEDHVQWMRDAVALRFVGDQTSGIGTRFVVDTKVGPLRITDEMAVTAWEPGAAMGVEHHGAVSGRGRFTLRPGPGGGTRFTWTEELQFPWWLGGSAGALAGRRVLAAVWRRNLETLKALVEARAAA